LDHPPVALFHLQSLRECMKHCPHRTPQPIFMILEIYNYIPDSTPHAKFQGATSTRVVWPNNQFDSWKFLSSFLLSSPRPQIASLDVLPRTIRH